MDIRSTLASVCKRVLLDRSVDDNTRLKRAQGLKLLGEFFMASGGSTEAGLGDMRQRLHQQMAGPPPAFNADEKEPQSQQPEKPAEK